MELDDLKESWEETNKDFKPLNTNIMELLKSKSYSPLAVLYAKYKYAPAIVPLLLGIFIYDFYKRPELLNDILLWFFFAFVILTTGFIFSNYNLLKKLMRNDKPTISNIKVQISRLERSIRTQFMTGLITIVIMFALIEWLNYAHLLGKDYSMITNYPFSVRILAYTAIVIAMYFIHKISFKKRFGIHLDHLKDLLKQAE